MRILAVGDIHSPRYLDGFVASLREHEPPDILLMAGDMINKGEVSEYSRLLDAIDDIWGKGYPRASCFGNEEYSSIRDEIVASVGSRIDFLDDRGRVYRVAGKRVGIVGTQGSLDKPTEWQKKNLPNIKSVFVRRAKRASTLLQEMSHRVDIKILLMHYSPCIETCVGEDERAFSWLGSRRFYTVVLKEQPDFVIHGHVHNSTVLSCTIGKTIVRNVAFPAARSLTCLELGEESQMPPAMVSGPRYHDGP